MLKITVELWPFGSEVHKKTLAVMDIANDGTGTATRGNYKVRRFGHLKWDEKVVENYARDNHNVLKLVYLALHKYYAD
jgi:hypothetical protein